MTRQLTHTKEKRSWKLTDEAFLIFQHLAQQQGIETSAFLETLSRELALERLSDEERKTIKQEAERISAKRKHAVQPSG